MLVPAARCLYSFVARIHSSLCDAFAPIIMSLHLLRRFRHMALCCVCVHTSPCVACMLLLLLIMFIQCLCHTRVSVFVFKYPSLWTGRLTRNTDGHKTKRQMYFWKQVLSISALMTLSISLPPVHCTCKHKHCNGFLALASGLLPTLPERVLLLKFSMSRTTILGRE